MFNNLSTKDVSKYASNFYTFQRALSHHSKAISHLDEKMLPVRMVSFGASLAAKVMHHFSEETSKSEEKTAVVTSLSSMNLAFEVCDLTLSAQEIYEECGFTLSKLCQRSIKPLTNLMLILQIPGVLLTAHKVYKAASLIFEVEEMDENEMKEIDLEEKDKESLHVGAAFHYDKSTLLEKLENRLIARVLELGLAIFNAASVTALYLGAATLHPLAWGVLAAGIVGEIAIAKFEEAYG